MRSWPGMRSSRAALAAAALALAAAGCGGGRTQTVTSQRTVTATVTTADASPGSSSPANFSVIPGVVRKVQPSVVTIFATLPQGQAEGSGVIWSADGTIVTNNHVVAGATRLEVALASGERVPARLKARDPLSDLAVITIDKQGLPPATFAQGLPEAGQLAIAIGSPLGFEESVTAGIVSGLHRSIPGGGVEGQALVDLLQTDAAISPGNSGGALVNGEGQVMGINVAYIPPQARAVSIGFAIPAPTVRNVVRQLLETGKAVHAFLGIQPADLTPDLAQRFDLSVSSGALVLNVVSRSAAARAGLQPGDVITQLGSARIRNVEDLLAALRTHRPGDAVQVTFVRNGSTRHVDVTLSGRSAG